MGDRDTGLIDDDIPRHFSPVAVDMAKCYCVCIVKAVRLTCSFDVGKRWLLGLSTLLLALLPASITGQDTISGRITTCGSTAPIPYATVYHRLSGVGTLADSTGKFELILPTGSPRVDSLTVSSVGYLSAIAPFRRNGELTAAVCLKASTIDLPTATATAARFNRESTFGNRSESRNIVSGWSVAPRNGAERGSRIRLPGKSEYILKTIRLHIAESTYDSLRLRFHIYAEADPTPKVRPQYSWLVDTGQSSGWISVDVLGDAISLREEVFVSVEVVEAWSDRSANQLYLSAGLLTDGLYYRERHFGVWERARAGLSICVVALGE
ncbi:carboxypeptidase-like regulatory domain-containing protein [Lewinella sp. IMCC34191]|uniref:carboxypeptidase-like regulatory domain-containing protein n=1 Tax=Lewinella sp. IMCC34191 TaxID=2259172 RepID=UPI000E25C784|nr:carboxypeptidase-like regulatory domain-containing protein [Lewinella sp. IMCC34191]